MSSINNHSFSFSHIQFMTGIHSPSASILGGILYCETPLEKISAKDFWVLMDTYFDKDWEFLYISPESKVSKERMQLYAKIKLDIPLAELEKIDKNLDLEILKNLATYEISPIFKAVSLGSISLMQKAIQDGDSINAVRKEPPFQYFCPLSLALFYGKFEAFQWLVDQKADSTNLTSVLDSFWPYALEHTAKFIPLFKNSKVLSYLFELESKIDFFAKCRAQYAAEKGDIKVLEFLIASGADIEKLGLIEKVVHKKQIECLKLLLQNFPDLSKDKTILNYGVQSENKEIVELLLAHGATYIPVKKSSSYDHPLYWASTLADKSIFHLLITKGFKLDSYNLVYFLVNEYLPKKFGKSGYIIRKNKKMEKSQLELLSLFVTNRALDVNLKNSKGIPLLHALILNDQDEAAEFFCSCPEIDLTATDANGMTALHIAVIRENRAVVAALLKAKAPVNAKTPTLITPLHLAADCVNSEIIDLLLSHGADLKALDYREKTPYHLAILNVSSESEIVKKKLFFEEVSVNPDYAYNCYKRTYNSSLKPLFKKIVKTDSELCKKEEQKKTLAAHIFSQKGESSMVLRKDKKDYMETASLTLSSLEGSQPFWISRKTLKILREFIKKDTSSKETPSFILSALEDYASSPSLSDDEILKGILDKKAIVLELGYWNHSSKILFFDDLLIICDRQGDRKAIEILKYDPKKLNREIISSLRGVITKSTVHYEKTLSQIKEKICIPSGDFENDLEKRCLQALGGQEVGNCTYASLEGICYILWAIHKIKSIATKDEFDWEKIFNKSSEEFRKFSYFMELSVIENYLDFHLSDKSLHYPDTQFVERLIKKIYAKALLNEIPQEELYLSFSKSIADKYSQFKDRFPHIHFSEPLPAETDFVAKSLKVANGKTPTYWTAFTTYGDTICTKW